MDEDICKQNGLNQVTIVDQSWILLFVSLKLCVKLGRYCAELHYGTIFGTLSLFLLAVTRLGWKTGSNFVLQKRNRPTVFPQCNSKQHQLSLTHSRPQCFRVWERSLFSTCAEELWVEIESHTQPQHFQSESKWEEAFSLRHIIIPRLPSSVQVI